MNAALEGIAAHMKELGLNALKHAIWHAHIDSEINPMWSELSVIQAAHAAEILIKARIAEEHPLLIFDQLPKSEKSNSTQLEFGDLIENGKTFQYSDLSDRLWACTGIQLENSRHFKDFGKLRNSIQHFASPLVDDLSIEVLKYIFSTIDPFINKCWGLFAIDFNEDYEPYLYLVPILIENQIPFLVSSGVARESSKYQFEWPNDENYKSLMIERFREKGGEL